VGLGADRPDGAARLDCANPAVATMLGRARAEGAPVLAALPGAGPVITPLDNWAGARRLEPGPAAGFVVRLGGSASTGPRLAPGRHRAYIRGSLGPGVRLYVDGRALGEAMGDLGLIDAWHSLGTFETDGRPDVRVLGLSRPILLSGSRRPDVTGPLAFVREPDARQQVAVDARSARRLCGRRLDWVALR
jgi:hypothetical protein